MQCPYCRGDSSVTETRVTADGLRRRRTCTNCKRRFTTYETVGSPGLKVQKRDGSVEPFDAAKLFRAMQRIAAHRTNLTDDDLHRVSRDIEANLLDHGHKSVLWSEIVTAAVERLRNLDPISAHRLEVNYTDESGAIRFDASSSPSPQLGLLLDEEE
ncbi:MAG TPA: ATP cone domain-containing protein [Kofleriaceae bacterium]